MASDESLTIYSSSMHDDDEEEEEEEEGGDLDYSHDTHHGYNMSRLSVCSGITDGEEEEEEDAMMRMSRLSVEEGSEGEADGELSDGKEALINGSESDKDSSTSGWFSLPATPRGRIQPGVDYASENEGRRERPRNRRRVRERWLERTWEMRKWKAMEEETMESGESECVVIAKPKGGGKSLCMDMEEVKACRDLGFDLQQPWTIEIPNSNRASGSTIDTDSGGTSPIANWRISSPGDDPRDVKARLKVWAQAVALASSRLNN